MVLYNRIRRIVEEIRKVVSIMFINGVKDFRIIFMVSVIDVEVINDLRYVYVYVSILGGDEEFILIGFKSVGGYIRREVGKNIKFRYIFEIVFKFDDLIEKGMYMDSFIKRVNEKNV